MSNESREADRETGAGATPRVTNDGEAAARAADGGSDERVRFDERLRAVERAVTGTDAAVADVADDAAATAERASLETRLTDLESRVEELEAATQALRGYAGSVRAVNREVERRADLALARASGGGERDGDGANDAGRHGDDADRHGDDADHRRGDVASSVPSESALDAAVPSGRGGGHDDGRRSEADASETDDGSWRAGALGRLRESL
ncbi:hypothetical protein C461_14041 [Halorubrum aidingense JCM 13560]|uniref:DUF7310 domain-containing protein n=1 Tax=Halorubrum aidingense JCM 13560 TaxID=1230454 RepID=M0P6P5_9EURY|nr:hypothetical protein [Halorubrum aidingense]EMA65827.1 hypothetical protein C461_14041 [Halorubrum aidingense JCM 13560]